MDTAFQNILSRFPGQRILVLGDVMLDEYLWGFVRRISQEAPVLVVDLHKRGFAPGNSRSWRTPYGFRSSTSQASRK